MKVRGYLKGLQKFFFGFVFTITGFSALFAGEVVAQEVEPSATPCPTHLSELIAGGSLSTPISFRGWPLPVNMTNTNIDMDALTYGMEKEHRPYVGKGPGGNSR